MTRRPLLKSNPPLPRDQRLADRLRDRLPELEPDARRRAEGLLRWWDGTRTWSSVQRRTVRRMVG